MNKFLGEIKSVKGTEYDLRTPKNLGEGINSLKEKGYDLNYCLNEAGQNSKDATFAARYYILTTIEESASSNYSECVSNAYCTNFRAVEPQSGRYLEVFTDQPGVQFYTGNFIPDGVGKRGTKFGKHSAFCFETQNFPNSVNIVSFDSCYE